MRAVTRPQSPVLVLNVDRFGLRKNHSIPVVNELVLLLVSAAPGNLF